MLFQSAWLICSPPRVACDIEVEANMAMVHAKPAILSLRELAPSLTDVKALQLAKGACTPAVLQRCNNEDPTALPEDRQTS